MIFRIIYFFICWFFVVNSYSWNALGHKLVAQIAYDNLSTDARQMVDQYNRSLDQFSRVRSFIVASTWLDYIRYSDIHWFDSLHYIDIPFTRDESPLPAIQETNALWGIKQALLVISSKHAKIVDKGLSLRILSHVVGDIHQPLHTVTQISRQYPRGDRGGNLFKLAKKSGAANLHQYWDRGGGILIQRSKQFKLNAMALELEKKWPCSLANHQSKPEQWIQETHELALTQAYQIEAGTIPDKDYQLNTQYITQKQIAFAGCRLAKLLNEISQR